MVAGLVSNSRELVFTHSFQAIATVVAGKKCYPCVRSVTSVSGRARGLFPGHMGHIYSSDVGSNALGRARICRSRSSCRYVPSAASSANGRTCNLCLRNALKFPFRRPDAARQSPLPALRKRRPSARVGRCARGTLAETRRELKAHAPLASAGMPELQGPGGWVGHPVRFPHSRKSLCVD
jgi:hypothetical protein